MSARRAPSRGDRRRGLRRPRLRAAAGRARRRPGHADRPQQLPPVPAAALPGGDLAARAERHRALAAVGVRRPEERRRQARRDLRGRPCRENRHLDRRRAMERGRARARRRLAAELLRHAGRRRELVSAVLARRRHAAALADPRDLRAGRPRPEADRARRAELRDRRRRADRRRGGGRDRRHALGDVARRRTGTSTPARRRSTCSTTATRCSSRSRTRPTATSPRCSRRRA